MALSLFTVEPAANHVRANSPGPSSRVSPRVAGPRFYRPELDLLRFGAFLMVWLDHALMAFHGLLPAAWLAIAEACGSCGVPVFFFLSAFLITELFRRERAATGRLRLGNFYFRRALRIWPLYFGVLALYAVLGFRLHGFHIEAGRLLASCLFAGNWYLVLHPAITTPMRALWSVSVEEQWYLVWPVLRRLLGDRHLLAACLGLILLSQTLLAVLAGRAGAWLPVTAWVNTGVQCQYFALGAGAALLLRGRVPQLDPLPRCLLALAAFGAFLAAAGVCHFKQVGVPHAARTECLGYALAGIGAAAIFFAVLGMPQRACPRVLVHLGQLSFGLYVFHETGFFLADALMRHAVPGLQGASSLAVRAAALTLQKLGALSIAVLLAGLSHRFWEQPFLRLKQRRAPVPSGAA